MQKAQLEQNRVPGWAPARPEGLSSSEQKQGPGHRRPAEGTVGQGGGGGVKSGPATRNKVNLQGLRRGR